MKALKTNFWHTALWVGMLALVLLSFWFAEGSEVNPAYLPILILFVALLKFIGIGFQFMELKNANRIWIFLFCFFILFFCLLVWFVN